MRKRHADPALRVLQREQRTMTKAIEDLQKIKTTIANRNEKSKDGKRVRGSVVRQVELAMKAIERALPIVNRYADKTGKIGNSLRRLEKESKQTEDQFDSLTESVLAWGKNVIQWHPPHPWEFDRLPVTLYQLRVYNAMDDPAEKFSTDKKKRQKAKAKRKRREQAALDRAQARNSKAAATQTSAPPPAKKLKLL